MSKIPWDAFMPSMPCLHSDLATATNVGLASVVVFTGTKDLAGAALPWVDPIWCHISVVKAVAGAWSGCCHMCTFTSLKAKSYLHLSLSYKKGHLGLLTLSNGYISPRESFWSHRWSWMRHNLKSYTKNFRENLPVPKKALSMMSKATVNIPVLTPQLHVEFVCSIIALRVLQLTFAVLLALQLRNFLSVHFIKFISLVISNEMSIQRWPTWVVNVIRIKDTWRNTFYCLKSSVFKNKWSHRFASMQQALSCITQLHKTQASLY